MSEINVSDKGKVLFLLVGPPASGKSTWGKQYSADNNVTYVSTDGIRGEIGTGEGDQSVSAAAFSIARNRATQSLSSGKSVMIDATNVNPKARKDWIKLAKDQGAFTVAVTFEVPYDELLRRDAKRERHVPPDVIKSFVDRYQRPTTQEVDKVIVK